MTDLIDRAALLKLFDERFEESHIQACTRQTGKTLWSGIKAGVNWGRNTVIEAPTIEAKPVVHGEWDFIGDYDSRCSVCGEEYCIGPNEDYNFCPNCGADMRGET